MAKIAGLQNIGKDTKKLIAGSLRAKNLKTLDIKPLKKHILVTYRTKQDYYHIYKVLKYERDLDNGYNVTVQKVEHDGKLGTNKFTTIMSKLNVFWIQIDDFFIYSEKRRGQQVNDFYGKVVAIFNDSTTSDIVVRAVDKSTGVVRDFLPINFGSMELIPEASKKQQ